MANRSRRGDKSVPLAGLCPALLRCRVTVLMWRLVFPPFPPLSLMRHPCSRHGESQTFCTARLYGHVACEPGADAQVVFQVKTQKRFFPVYTNTPMLNQLACSWNSIYFCQRGDLDIMRAMQEILLAAIYHRVERRHICVYLKESAHKISISDLDEKLRSDPLPCQRSAPVGSHLFVFSQVPLRK